MKLFRWISYKWRYKRQMKKHTKFIKNNGGFKIWYEINRDMF